MGRSHIYIYISIMALELKWSISCIRSHRQCRHRLAQEASLLARYSITNMDYGAILWIAI